MASSARAHRSLPGTGGKLFTDLTVMLELPEQWLSISA
jgi:hypothetical protein